MTDPSGVWYNQLGSKMILRADAATGALTGRYHSRVGDVPRCYDLSGRFDPHPPSGKGLSLGWAVTYLNTTPPVNSTATWSGQYFNGTIERILTHWLLTRSSPVAGVWSSTNIGTDTFTRNQPTVDEIAQARAFTVCSPSPEDIFASMNPAPDEA